MTTPASPGPPPPAAQEVFGDRLPLAAAYTDLLATTGVQLGLVGPREVPRLWERHVLNCGVVAELIAPGTRVIDVGSGAGLPGLVLAIAREDLDVHLVEPMLRRTTWLQESVDALSLTNVTIHRGRADVFAGQISAPVVTARAVSRLSTLAEWCAPLLDPGGRLLALKGVTAAEELAQDAPQLARWGFLPGELVFAGAGLLDPPTRVVRVPMGRSPRSTRRTRGQGRGRRR